MGKDIKELVRWLSAFTSCRMTAFFHCPEDIFAELRSKYLDIELDPTPEGERLLRGTAECDHG